MFFVCYKVDPYFQKKKRKKTEHIQKVNKQQYFNTFQNITNICTKIALRKKGMVCKKTKGVNLKIVH